MKEFRKIEFYKDYFITYYLGLPSSVQKKYEYVFVVIKQAEKVPIKFLKKIKDTQNLFEIRVESGSDIYRTFCSLEEKKIVVLYNSFQKKSAKTPSQEITKAIDIQKEYYEERND